MNEQLAVDLPRAPVSTQALEDELKGIVLGERDHVRMLRKFEETLERRRDEVTISLILTMGSQLVSQFCTWWVLGRTIRSAGKDASQGGRPFETIELRSLVYARTCNACKHTWNGTDREQCPPCGSKDITKGDVKPFNYKIGMKDLGAKELRTAQMRGESIHNVRSARLDARGVFRVSVEDAYTILKRYGLGVLRQEWTLKPGQRENYDIPGRPPSPVRGWPIKDKCIVAETAHEVLLETNRAAQVVES